MKVVHGLSEMKGACSGSVLTIGNFDGLHIGHRALIHQVVEKASINNVLSSVLTFFPHPSMILRPDNPTRRLLPLEDLEEQLAGLGVDLFVIEPFSRDFSLLGANEFIEQKIVPAFHPREIIVGYDFAFGREREGSYQVLERLARQFNFNLSRQEPIYFQDEVVSSSRIRKLLSIGDVKTVSQLLTRSFYLSGRVERGEGRGEKLGFPTANLKTMAEVLPADGVYITHFHVGKETFASLTNIGHKPTFHESYELSVETHVLNEARSFYGEIAKVGFLARIRPELKFPSKHELITQIEKDVRQAKKYFGL